MSASMDFFFFGSETDDLTEVNCVMALCRPPQSTVMGEGVKISSRVSIPTMLGTSISNKSHTIKALP